MTTPPATRRDFLKTAAATGAVLAAGGALNAHAAGSDEIRVGIIGCGGRGAGAGDNVLNSAKGVKIVAIGDVFQNRVDSARRRFINSAQGGKIKELGNSVDLPPERCFVGLDNYEKVINSDANYIILATPPGFRPQHIEATINAGKNLFTEKPVGVDGPGIRKVLAAAETAATKKLGVGAGTQRRHERPYVEAFKRIQDGLIGDITALRAYWNGGGIWFRERQSGMSDVAYQLHNWYHFVWTCGDHITEQHVHNLDVCNWAMKGPPSKCVGMGYRIRRPKGDPNVVGHIYDFFAVDYEYPNGVHMLSTCRHLSGGDNNVSEAVVGTKGTWLSGGHRVNGKPLFDRDYIRQSVDPYVQEHTDLIESIRSGNPLNELKGVAESTLTAIMGRMSAYTGKPVTYQQALDTEEEISKFPANLTWDSSLPVAPVPLPGRPAQA